MLPSWQVFDMHAVQLLKRRREKQEPKQRFYYAGRTGRKRDRGHELYNFPRTGRGVCAATSRRLLALHDSHARNEKPGGASERAAAPPPSRFSSSRTPAHTRPALCANSRARASELMRWCRPWGWGRRTGAAPKWGELGLAFRRWANSGRCATISGAGHCHVPVSSWC